MAAEWEKHNLYAGDVELQFNEGSHRYKVNGRYVVGVTTIEVSQSDQTLHEVAPAHEAYSQTR